MRHSFTLTLLELPFSFNLCYCIPTLKSLSLNLCCLPHLIFPDFPHNQNYPGDAGTLVDTYISGKVVQYKEQIATLEKFQIVQYKEQIATLEKREDRYKTVFVDKIFVFRRACCPLFCHKVFISTLSLVILIGNR
ncbi:hypothetical protein RHMOL_Rhmol02G0185300 [Rhododendron molle]|uniref:Uncharacterized protein n=1 Tax=Rhododendron molle TaxID=49168 RepID=A0ACC0PS26_RHOML|nr:hypothetical protein RHMOL_Rhmol02G0185300 [Rhododendron molle]